jgi:hypothetical protein
VAFSVQKILATGSFRFVARRRRELSSIDDDLSLSTGPTGEFVRHRDEVFFAADHRPIRRPELPKPRSIATTPFFRSVFDGTSRGYGFIALTVVGILFVFLGFANVVKGNNAGWVLVILGLIMAAVPVALTANKRRIVRAEEMRREKERAERDAREREMLAAYAATLDALRDSVDDQTLAAVRREREKLDLPYSIWGDAARSTVQQVGFQQLEKVGTARAAEIAALMDRASAAAGLVQEDVSGVKHALYSTVLWHFIADDRLGTAQKKIVRELQSGMGITDEDVPVDTTSEAQFERLRGIDHRNVPRCQASVQLQHHEYCIHASAAEVTGIAGNATAVITNKRVIVQTAKPEEVAIASVDDIEVDADASTVTVQVSGRKRPLVLKTAEPVFFASMLSLSTTLDERPKGFM